MQSPTTLSVEIREVPDLDRLLKVLTYKKYNVPSYVINAPPFFYIQLDFTLKLVGEVDVLPAFEEYHVSGGTETRPFEATQVVNIILNYMANVEQATFVTHGNSIFNMTTQRVRIAFQFLLALRDSIYA